MKLLYPILILLLFSNCQINKSKNELLSENLYDQLVENLYNDCDNILEHPTIYECTDNKLLLDDYEHFLLQIDGEFKWHLKILHSMKTSSAEPTMFKTTISDSNDTIPDVLLFRSFLEKLPNKINDIYNMNYPKNASINKQLEKVFEQYGKLYISNTINEDLDIHLKETELQLLLLRKALLQYFTSNTFFSRNVSFCHPEIFSSLGSSVFRRGDTMDIIFGIQNSHSFQVLHFYINNEEIPATHFNQVMFSTTVQDDSGQDSLVLKMEYINPDNTISLVEKTLHYTIIE